MKEKVKAPDNEIMMRKCLFGWFCLIYEAINLFISVHNRNEWRAERARKKEKWIKFRTKNGESWRLIKCFVSNIDL